MIKIIETVRRARDLSPALWFLFFSENVNDAAGESTEGQTEIPRRATVTDSAEASTSRCECARTTSHERFERCFWQTARGRAESRNWSQTQQVRNFADGTKLHSGFMRSSTETRQQEIDPEDRNASIIYTIHLFNTLTLFFWRCIHLINLFDYLIFGKSCGASTASQFLKQLIQI